MSLLNGVSVAKAARLGSTYGEIAGPEGEAIGAGLAVAAQLASSIYRHYSSSSEDSKENEPLIRINRPGIAQIHPTLSGARPEGLRQRVVPAPTPTSNGSSERSDTPAFIPAQSTSPFVTPEERPNRINVRTIDRYGRRPLIATIAAAGVGAAAAAPSSTSKQQKVDNPPSTNPNNPFGPPPPLPTSSITSAPLAPLPTSGQSPFGPPPPLPTSSVPLPTSPATPSNPFAPLPTSPAIIPTPLPRPTRAPHNSARPSQQIFTTLDNRVTPMTSSRPYANKSYVGDYKFPLGAYNYVDYNKYAQNNTIASLI